MYIWNPKTEEVEARGLGIQDHPQLQNTFKLTWATRNPVLSNQRGRMLVFFFFFSGSLRRDMGCETGADVWWLRQNWRRLAQSLHSEQCPLSSVITLENGFGGFFPTGVWIQTGVWSERLARTGPGRTGP